jgi:nucleotide-binding universal stress UspA family protein
MRILLATDGSNEAQAAAEWLRKLPVPATTRVLIVAVAQTHQTTSDIARVLEEDAHQVVEITRKLIADRWPNLETRVAEGDPRPVLLRVAEEWKADIVVVGARGLGAFAGMVLGSVSSGLARHATCSVLIAKGPPRPLKTVLVAIDGSADSLAAARLFTSMPLDPAIRVRLLSVAERPYYPSTAPGIVKPMINAAINDIIRERTAELEKVLSALEKELQAQKRTVEHAVVVGSPANTVVDEVNRAQADLVVVGARGLGGFQRVLLGSVSESVMLNAPCPVLIVKPPAA